MYLLYHQTMCEGALFVDKLPVNYLNIPSFCRRIAERENCTVRGPLDACFASFKQLFADAYLHSYDQGEMVIPHARYRDLMAHFHAEFPGKIIDVSARGRSERS